MPNIKWKINLFIHSRIYQFSKSWRMTSQVLRLPLGLFLFLLIPQEKKECHQSRPGHPPEDSQQTHHDQTVGSPLRVVHVAIKDNLIGERSDLARRRVHHSEAQVSRRIFDSVKIT